MNRMPFEPDLSLRRSKRVGVRICVAAALLAALFVWGVALESYWALAIPVAVAVLTALSLMFWIGYTVNTVRGIPAEAEHYRSDAARWIALGICALSILLPCPCRADQSPGPRPPARYCGGSARQSAAD